MHFNCLIALNGVPDTTNDDIVSKAVQHVFDQKVGGAIAILRDLQEQDPRNFYIGIRIADLNCRRNHFSRVMEPLIYKAMEPYNEQTEDEQYLAFCNVEEQYREEYETEKTDCARLPDGTIRPLDYRFTIIDGQVYQKRAGRLHHPMRTKKARKMKAYPDFPLKKAFKSAEQYMEYLGYTYDEDNKAFGFYCNPNGYWDWFAFGGRWPRAFLVKEECEEYGVGHREHKDDRYPAPKGYRWVCMARKKDIDWKMTYRTRIQEGMEVFRLLKKAHKTKKVPENCFWQITEREVKSFGDTLYNDGENLYENLKNRGVLDKSQYHTRFYGFFTENGCEDIWMHRKNEDEYRKKLDNYIASLPDDAVLVAVDCHS